MTAFTKPQQEVIAMSRALFPAADDSGRMSNGVWFAKFGADNKSAISALVSSGFYMHDKRSNVLRRTF